MLEKPELADHLIVARLRDAYGLCVGQLDFLPIGNDRDTAAYRVVAEDGTPYFLKLRRGALNQAAILMPHFLLAQGIAPVIAPIETRDGQLWTDVDGFTTVLYPFVAGRNGSQRRLSDRHWVELGAALRGMHAAVLPDALRWLIPEETFGSKWRDAVRAFQARAWETAFADPIADELAAFLRARQGDISQLVERAEELGRDVRARSLPPVPCHADLHANNVLIDGRGTLFIVDWDTLSLAPKERDLMFIGAGIAGIWHSPREAALFYQGYGPTAIDAAALVYYRYERIVVDIAEYCAQLLLTDAGGADRPRGLRNLVGAFRPGQVVDIARESDRLLLAT